MEWKLRAWVCKGAEKGVADEVCWASLSPSSPLFYTGAATTACAGHNALETKRNAAEVATVHTLLYGCSTTGMRAMLSGGAWYPYVRMSLWCACSPIYSTEVRNGVGHAVTSARPPIVRHLRHVQDKPSRQLGVVKGRAGTPRLFLPLALTFLHTQS